MSSDERLAELELSVIRLATYAGHDDDCLTNRAPSDGIVPGACSCGYVEAYRAVRAALGDEEK